jgi:hypothetical protein
MDSDDLDLFDDESEVVETRMGLGRVLGAHAGAGVLDAIVAIVLATLATAGRPQAETLCGGAPSCTDLSVSQVAQLTGLALPEGSTVVESRYESDAEQILVEATVELPFGAANPFDGGSYFVVDSTPLELPAGSDPYGYYAATGEMGALVGDGALVETTTKQIVVVRVQRTL